MKKGFWVISILVFPVCALFCADLVISASDVRLEPEYAPGGAANIIGYHLYIRKKPDIRSVMLTESTKDPKGLEYDYAYRSTEWNKWNGDEIRYLNGKRLTGEWTRYSILDSTPERDAQFGEAFHLYIPRRMVYGNPWSRNGEVTVENGTFVNIRSFGARYGDYTNGFRDNPFTFNFVAVPHPPSPLPPIPMPEPAPVSASSTAPLAPAPTSAPVPKPEQPAPDSASASASAPTPALALIPEPEQPAGQSVLESELPPVEPPAENPAVQARKAPAGFFLTGGLQYYILPDDPKVIVKSTLPGLRLGAGWELPLGPGSLALGVEIGWTAVGLWNPSRPAASATLFPLAFKAGYGFPLTRAFSLRLDALAGGLLTLDGAEYSADLFFGGRLCAEWIFMFSPGKSPLLSLYFGGGVDLVPQIDGLVTLPTAELGLRVRFGNGK